MKRGLLAGVLAAGFLLVSPTGAGAWATYCDWDPLVPVITPSGNIVLVYDSVWTSNLLDLGVPLESYTTSRVYVDGRPETAVDMAIFVPSGLLFQFQTQDQVRTGILGTGQLLAVKNGWSGQTLHLKFTLATP
jgi:hypothetical protein